MNRRGFLGVLVGVPMVACATKVASAPVEEPAADTSNASYWYALIVANNPGWSAWDRLELAEAIADRAAADLVNEQPGYKGYSLTHLRIVDKAGITHRWTKH